MLIGEGNENLTVKKTTIGLINKKATLQAQHTFFVHFFAVVLHDYNGKWKFQNIPSYTFYGGNVVHVVLLCFLFFVCLLFFSPPLIFTLVAASISDFLIATFFISRPSSPFFFLFSPFSIAGLPPTFSFSLSFSFSIFQICGHDN